MRPFGGFNVKRNKELRASTKNGLCLSSAQIVTCRAVRRNMHRAWVPHQKFPFTHPWLLLIQLYILELKHCNFGQLPCMFLSVTVEFHFLNSNSTVEPKQHSSEPLLCRRRWRRKPMQRASVKQIMSLTSCDLAALRRDGDRSPVRLMNIWFNCGLGWSDIYFHNTYIYIDIIIA